MEFFLNKKPKKLQNFVDFGFHVVRNLWRFSGRLAAPLVAPLKVETDRVRLGGSQKSDAVANPFVEAEPVLRQKLQ